MMNDNRRKFRRWQGLPMKRRSPDSLLHGSQAIAEVTRRLQASLRVMPPSVAITAAERVRQLEWARAQLHVRRTREAVFGKGLFSEPAWDMLLELFVARIEGRRVTVKSACVASGVPQTTALRHLALLVSRGLIERRRHPADSRSTHVALTEEGFGTMIDYVTRASAPPTGPEG